MTLLHVALVWLGVVVILLLIAIRAQRRFVWMAACVAEIIVSGVPTLFIAWSLVKYLTSDHGFMYAEGPPKLSDFSLLDWIVLSVPAIATLLGVCTCILRLGSVTKVQDE